MMTIGQLGRRVGIRPSAIRYYEAQGVLTPAVRSANEYRLYGADAENTLRFVQSAKALGFSLEEVKQVITEASHDQPPCALTRALIDRHLEHVESELCRLRVLRGRLKRLQRHAPPNGTDALCPLIESE